MSFGVSASFHHHNNARIEANVIAEPPIPAGGSICCEWCYPLGKRNIPLGQHLPKDLLTKFGFPPEKGAGTPKVEQLEQLEQNRAS
jgi:hypothetical protein